MFNYKRSFILKDKRFDRRMKRSMCLQNTKSVQNRAYQFFWVLYISFIVSVENSLVDQDNTP